MPKKCKNNELNCFFSFLGILNTDFINLIGKVNIKSVLHFKISGLIFKISLRYDFYFNFIMFIHIYLSLIPNYVAVY